MNQPRTLSPAPPVTTESKRDTADRSGKDGRPSRRACVIAGIGLVVMAALAGVGYFVAVEGLVTPGDATTTTTDIAASRGLFRLGIISLLGVVALDIVVAWALYRVFAPVRPTLSAVAAAIRYVYAGVFGLAVLQLVAALQLIGPANGSGVPPAHAVLQKIEAFHTIWDVGLILFGLHLVVIAYLVHRSHFLPRFLGILLAVAAVGYMFDSAAALLLTAPPPEISTVTFLGEFLLALWLLFGARRISADSQPRGRSS